MQDPKVAQILPGGGWKLQLAWVDDEGVKTSLTEVVAWALVQYEDSEDIMPVIPHPTQRFFTWQFGEYGIASSLVQPGHNPTPEQLQFVNDYALEKEEEAREHSERCAKARKMRVEGTSFESIAKVTGLSMYEARRIAMSVDDQIRSEKKVKVEVSL